MERRNFVKTLLPVMYGTIVSEQEQFPLKKYDTKLDLNLNAKVDFPVVPSCSGFFHTQDICGWKYT